MIELFICRKEAGGCGRSLPLLAFPADNTYTCGRRITKCRECRTRERKARNWGRPRKEPQIDQEAINNAEIERACNAVTRTWARECASPGQLVPAIGRAYAA